MHFMLVNGWKTIHFQSKFSFLRFGKLFDVFGLDMVYWIFTTNFQKSYGSSFMGSNIKNYKEYRVLKTSSLATS